MKKVPAWPPFPWQIRQVEYGESNAKTGVEKGVAYWQGKNTLTGETTALYKNYEDVYGGIELRMNRKYSDKWGGM